MSNANIGPILSAITEAASDLVPTIIEWFQAGHTAEQIQEKLKDPNSVGQALIKRAAERQDLGKKLLGRDPK